jgi:NAD-dependent dihydropyrimidine dehydrogenase PreA subunit
VTGQGPAPSPQHGVFIRVDVDESVRGDAELAKRLEEACPVDIFAAGDGVRIVDENLDECVLCGLCLDASPPGAVRVVKLYDGGAVLERAS